MLSENKNQTREQIIETVFALYGDHGGDEYIGEPVSQLEHMSQAAQLAIDEGYDDEVVLAAFFHDIGHLCVSNNLQNSMGGYGIKRHEQVGADYLRAKGFSERIVHLVENHVQAKRYLTFKNAEYFNKLSDASKKTLEIQGGKMGGAEAVAFENDQLFAISIRMRHWDELAKEINVAVINIDTLKAMAAKIIGFGYK